MAQYYVNHFLSKQRLSVTDICSISLILAQQKVCKIEKSCSWFGRTAASHCKMTKEQECIPVGCVPAARRPYAGVCFPEGVCLLWGVCSRGVSTLGVSAPGGCLLGGVSAPGGMMVSQHALRQTPPLWTEWMTDRCKNITLATTSLRPVINDPWFWVPF